MSKARSGQVPTQPAQEMHVARSSSKVLLGFFGPAAMGRAANSTKLAPAGRDERGWRLSKPKRSLAKARGAIGPISYIYPLVPPRPCAWHTRSDRIDESPCRRIGAYPPLRQESGPLYRRREQPDRQGSGPSVGLH